MSEKLGPYQINSIVQGDCLEVMKNLPDGCVDLVATDPPYNVSRPNSFSTMKRYNSYSGVDFAEWDHGFDQIGWLSEIVRVMSLPSSIIVWNSWQNLSMISVELERLGLSAKRVLVWKKTNPMPTNRDRLFTSSFEFALWATKGKKWVFNRRTETYETGFFEYPNNNCPGHPTAKPLGLFEELIQVLSDPGDLIFDPFIGSGTTAVAADRKESGELQ